MPSLTPGAAAAQEISHLQFLGDSGKHLFIFSKLLPSGVDRALH